jgi:hypothetical protein
MIFHDERRFNAVQNLIGIFERTQTMRNCCFLRYEKNTQNLKDEGKQAEKEMYRKMCVYFKKEKRFVHWT